MFVLTLLGNGTYLASILVRSVSPSVGRDHIRSYLLNKLPWIVDAVACLVQDFVIVLQLTYARRKFVRQQQVSTG